MRRKHLYLGSVVVLVSAAIWSLGIISAMHYRLPDSGNDSEAGSGSVYMVNGLKIGEVNSDSAIIWTRLTRNPETEPDTEWGRLVTGVSGEVRVAYWPADDESRRKETAWFEVDADRDFTRQLLLADLLLSG